MSKTRIEKDTDILLRSNVWSSYSYDNGRGAILDLEAHGDEDTLTFAELKSFASGSSKVALQKFYVIISDVYEEDVELDEVIRQLKLDKYYNKAKEILGTDEITVDSFEEFIEGCSEKELSEAIEVDFLRECLVGSCIEMFRHKKVEDGKLRIVLNAIGVEDIYSFISEI